MFNVKTKTHESCFFLNLFFKFIFFKGDDMLNAGAENITNPAPFAFTSVSCVPYHVYTLAQQKY